MKVMITGNTGFIGSNMENFLAKKSDVEIIPYSRSNGKDIFDKNTLKNEVEKVDLVIHFAAYAKPGLSIKEPEKAVKLNVDGCMSVLEACRKHDTPIVYPSSCEIYGDSLKPITEDFPLKAPNPYSASKAAADQLCHAYYKSYGLGVKSVRLFNPYGPNQQMNKIIPVFYKQAVRDKDITVYGDGSDTRDYVFVDDIVRGLWDARKLEPGEIINLATGVSTTNKEVAEMVIKYTDSDSNINFVDYPENFGNIINQVGSGEKAKKMMGWEPKVDLKTGLKKTISWLEGL
ncbi:MAG: GDP-mannose 4,6-dehydratase [Thermoplasmata archaeon]